ncbi:MAG: sulfotransferase, partial [Rickettsiales bacterium]|nr:sulfotransferase [Rickettsiales bacterium]
MQKSLKALLQAIETLDDTQLDDVRFWRNLYPAFENGDIPEGKTQALARQRLLRMGAGFDEGRSLFFIAGCFKSGTTWLRLLLNAHPQLHCHPEEIHAFSSEITELYHGHPVQKREHGARHDRFSIVRKLKCQALFGMILSQCDKPWARRYGGKGPASDLEALIEEYPEIRIPVIVRDGRDIATSAAFFLTHYANDTSAFTDASRTAFTDTFIINWAQNFMAVYGMYLDVQAQYPKNIHFVRYEDLLANTRKTLEKILCFLEVSVDDKVVKYCVERNRFEVLSEGRESGNEDRTSF